MVYYSMEFRQLRYFVTVAEELHFGRAAERLHITQPALSKQIASLEQELAVTLLLRTKRRVQLTHAGDVFFTQARQLLAQTNAAIQLTKRTDRGEIGSLAIGFTATATHTVLPLFLRDFRQQYPQVEVTLQELATEAQVEALNQNRIALAFLHPPIAQQGLEVHPIFDENFVAFLPLNHPLSNHDCIPLEALANEPLIIHPREEGPVIYDGFIQVCQQDGFQPKIVKESISLQTRVCLVTAGMGITFTSDRLQSLVGVDVVCKPLADCPIRLKFAATWRKTASNPVLRESLKILLDKTLKAYPIEATVVDTNAQ
ncbi:MAG: LysR family transcriptional regulator [Leptolyngbyaceae cyanobacterium]